MLKFNTISEIAEAVYDRFTNIFASKDNDAQLREIYGAIPYSKYKMQDLDLLREAKGDVDDFIRDFDFNPDFTFLFDQLKRDYESVESYISDYVMDGGMNLENALSLGFKDWRRSRLYAMANTLKGYLNND